MWQSWVEIEHYSVCSTTSTGNIPEVLELGTPHYKSCFAMMSAIEGFHRTYFFRSFSSDHHFSFYGLVYRASSLHLQCTDVVCNECDVVCNADYMFFVLSPQTARLYWTASHSKGGREPSTFQERLALITASLASCS